MIPISAGRRVTGKEWAMSNETLAELLQLGGQYFLPIAALLRALYEGVRGRFPEGFSQIALASVFAGISSVVDGGEPDLRAIVLGILGNTLFMAGLLSFIMVYLLRQPDRGPIVDGIVGGVLGLIAWAIWVYLLLNDWPVWTFILAIIAGAAGFIALRFALRQILRVVRIATYFIVIGLVLVAGAGAFLLLQTLTSSAA
jgi:hypothetical protein